MYTSNFVFVWTTEQYTFRIFYTEQNCTLRYYTESIYYTRYWQQNLLMRHWISVRKWFTLFSHAIPHSIGCDMIAKHHSNLVIRHTLSLCPMSIFELNKNDTQRHRTPSFSNEFFPFSVCVLCKSVLRRFHRWMDTNRCALCDSNVCKRVKIDS